MAEKRANAMKSRGGLLFIELYNLIWSKMRRGFENEIN